MAELSRKARIAPTPSGYLHAGNLANFLLNAQLAGEGGELLLRIDDLDRGRYRPEYVRDIFRCLDKLDIPITQGPRDFTDFEQSWSQDHRMESYARALLQLKEDPRIFACKCSRSELSSGVHPYGCLDRKVNLRDTGVAWRINTRAFTAPVVIPDAVTGESFAVELHDGIPDFAVRTKAGRPSYQLACTVDDHHFGVTHVGRGQDLLDSTAAQSVISDLLGWPRLTDRIKFVHHPLVLDTDGGKISKSTNYNGAPLALTDRLRDGLYQLVSSWLAK